MAKKELKLVFNYNDSFYPSAPILEVSFSAPISLNLKQCIKSHGMIDSGASMTMIPQWIADKLELKYTNKINVTGATGEQESNVYPILIVVEPLGNFITEVITWDKEFALIGRDLLNQWLILLNGPDKKFEISLSKSNFFS